MSKQPTITMDSTVVRQLAFDVANDYFTDEELCVRYDLTLGQLKFVAKQPSFNKSVLDTRQLLADDGKQLLLKAKEYVLDVLSMYKDIADDSDNTSATRMKAGDAIMELARVKVQPNNIIPIGGAGGVALHIHTNLNLGKDSIEGSYLAEAKMPSKKPVQEAVEAEFVEMDASQLASDPASEFL
tara:strand:+ start:1548 stop:2099 length:552 start_codon:yes stop_codon:yes gene_type:complete